MTATLSALLRQGLSRLCSRDLPRAPRARVDPATMTVSQAVKAALGGPRDKLLFGDVARIETITNGHHHVAMSRPLGDATVDPQLRHFPGLYPLREDLQKATAMLDASTGDGNEKVLLNVLNRSGATLDQAIDHWQQVYAIGRRRNSSAQTSIACTLLGPQGTVVRARPRSAPDESLSGAQRTTVDWNQLVSEWREVADRTHAPAVEACLEAVQLEATEEMAVTPPALATPSVHPTT